MRCVRTGGRGKHNHICLGGAFRKAKNEIRRRKNRNRKVRAGKNSFSQTLSLFARPSGKLKILFKKSSSFRIKTAPAQIIFPITKSLRDNLEGILFLSPDIQKLILRKDRITPVKYRQRWSRFAGI